GKLKLVEPNIIRSNSIKALLHGLTEERLELFSVLAQKKPGSLTELAGVIELQEEKPIALYEKITLEFPTYTETPAVNKRRSEIKSTKYNIMTELRQINKQDFLQELKYRVENEEITEEEIIILMRIKFGKTVGTEIRDPHPAVIISNNWQNEKGSRVVVLPMSSQVEKIYPFDIYVGKIISNYKESKIMCEQVKSVSKKRLSKNRVGVLPPELLTKILFIVKEIICDCSILNLTQLYFAIYANQISENELTLEQDNQGKIYQEQISRLTVKKVINNMIMKNKKNSLSEKEKSEYQKYLEELEDPDYQGGSWALPENPTPLEQAKYDICQKVIRYKRNNKLTTEELAKKIQLTKPETEDILYYRIDYFTLDRLMEYTNKLFSPCREKIAKELILSIFKEKLNGKDAEPEPKKNPNWKRDHYVLKRIPFGDEKYNEKLSSAGLKLNELTLEQDNQGQIYQEQIKSVARLPENPTTLEKAKYELCEKILGYQQDNNLSDKEIAQKIHLTTGETRDILYCHIDYFTLNHLITYAGRLFAPSQVKVIVEPEKDTIHARTV
ncbi:26228_t:CDS:2, partial [Gigaspora margarita]